MLGTEYARYRLERLKKSPRAWHLKAKPLDSKGLRITRRTLEKLSADQALIEELMTARKIDSAMDDFTHFSTTLRILGESLRNDIDVYTNSKFHNLFEKTGLAIVELGGVYAVTTNVDDYLNPLDGHAIFIEIGTHYAVQLLAKSIILENFENEYDAYRECGSKYLDAAEELYISKNEERTKEVYFHGLPEEVEADASAAQSSVSIKVLQFIALHEFGHVVNGDVDMMLANSSIVQGNQSEPCTKNTFEQEYKADLFALDALFSDPEKSLNHWSGFYAIFYFFAWLHSVEMKNAKPISHPPSLERAWGLHSRLMELTNNNDHGYTDLLIDVENRFNERH